MKPDAYASPSHKPHKPHEPRKPIVIVGAGPTGLLLGIELARRGVPFRLLDRNQRSVLKNAAIFLKSRSLEILAGLGLIDDFLSRGQIVEGVDVYLGERRVGGYRFESLDTPFPFILSIPEEETVALLTGKLEQLAGKVERGIELVGVEQSEEGVRARLTSDATGEITVEAEWLVGTDGYHSTVREAVGDPFEGADYPELWGVVDGRIEGWRHARNVTCAQLEPPNAIPFPLGHDRWRVYFRPATTERSELEAVNARLSLVSPGARLVDTDEPRFFRSHSRIARRFRAGRVLIAGDAAHGSNPIEGHGMNAGLQDAFNLGWKLALMATGRGSDPLIESYEAERRPVDRSIVESGDEAYHRMKPAGVNERQAVADFLATPEGPTSAASAESEIEYVYGHSPVVVQVGPSGPLSPIHCDTGGRVGEVADLVGCRGGVRLHEIVGGVTPSLFMLAMDAPQTEVEELRRVLREARDSVSVKEEPIAAFVAIRAAVSRDTIPEDVLYDPSGLLHQRLCASQPTLCLIRPDGHLGFRSTPPSVEALRAYLDRVYGPHS